MKLPRFLHRCYAFLMSYFWLPCPLCKEYFGGHEVTHWRSISDPSRWGIKNSVCRACAKRTLKSQSIVIGIDLAKPGSDITGYMCTYCKAVLFSSEEANQHVCAGEQA